jgi:general secretion pathway protein N
LHGAAQLFWDGAGSDLSSVNPLGDYRLDVNGEGENVVFKLATVRGALEVTGQGHWQPLRDGMLQINGYARARAQQKELQPLLQFLGAEQGGRRLFQLRLQLPVRNFLPL